MRSKARIIVKFVVVLLLTRDVELEEEAAKAAKASGARLMVARSVSEGLQIVYERSRELDPVVIDFHKTGGMTLLRALRMSRADLPLVALTSTHPDHSTELAHADGAACCLSKPMNAAELEMVIRLLSKSKLQVKAHWSKGD
jgi:DNA-binding response OmpR family regulator